jgi:hypothetical protein
LRAEGESTGSSVAEVFTKVSNRISVELARAGVDGASPALAPPMKRHRPGAAKTQTNASKNDLSSDLME